MKFIVAQVGARRGYAVPAILEKAGMLDRFYTDITGDIGLGAVFSAAAVLPLVGKSARRLAARRLPFNIRAKTTTFPGISLVHALREAMVARDPAAECREGVSFFQCARHGDDAVWLWQCYPHVLDAWRMRSTVCGRETAWPCHCVRDLCPAEH